MTQLSREMLIKINTEGADYSAQQIRDVQESIDGVNKASDQLGTTETRTSGMMKRNFAERMRQNREYQALNKATNGQLDQMVTKAEAVRGKLSDVSAIRMGTLAAGLGYVSYQLNRINSAGGQVNKSLDQMSIKLSATIKESRKLGSITEAKAQSKEYVDWARKYAAKTPFEQTEVIGAMSNLAPVFKGDLKKIQSAVEAATILAQIDPVQGFEGAVYAIREAQTGSTLSLSSRFEISKSQLNRYLKGGPNQDIGAAIKSALKENGQTMEMVEQFSTTVDGMESNLADSRNFIAGNFNRPIFEAQKQNLYFRQDQMKRYTEAGAGMDSSMSALGQLGGSLLMGKNLLTQGALRPANAQRMKLLDALAPGMIQARAGLEEASTKAEVNDLEARFSMLTSVEHQRLKDLRKRLREIPIEAAKSQREAELYIDKSADYIAKVMGLSGEDAKKVKNWMHKTSKDFLRMVEDSKKFLTGPSIKKFVNDIVAMGKSLKDALVDGPKQLYAGLKANGVIDTFKDAMVEISKSLGELGIKLGGTGTNTAKLISDSLNAAILGTTKVITMLSVVLKPIIMFLKQLIMGTLGVAKFVADIVDRLVQGGSNLVAKVLRSMGKEKEAEQIEASAAELKFQRDAGGNVVVPAGVNPAAPAGYGVAAAAGVTAAAAPAAKTPESQNRERGVAGYIREKYTAAKEGILSSVGITEGLTAGGVIGAALGAAGIYGMGQNIKRTWNAGRAAGAGVLGGVRSLGAGAMGLFNVGGPGIRESFKPANLLRARGMGGAVGGVALNTLLPGSPVTILYNIMLGYQTIKMAIQLIAKWTKGGFSTSARVIKDVFVGIGKNLTSLVNPRNWRIPGLDKVKTFLRNGLKSAGSAITGIFGSITRFFGGLGSRIAAFLPQLYRLPIIGAIVKKAAVGLGIAATGVAAATTVPAQITGAASYYGTRLVTSNVKVGGQTIDQNVQDRYIQLAARSATFARMIGIDQKTAKEMVKAQNERKKAMKSKSEQTKESVDATKDIQSQAVVVNSTAIFAKAVLEQMGYSKNQIDASGVFAQGSGATGIFAPGGAAGGAATAIGGKPVSVDKQKKFREVVEAARAAGDPHPEVTAAQWALESGWGKSESGKNNYFGIKAKPGEKGTLRWTTEQDKNGNKYRVQARFRDFDTLQEGMAARVALLKSGRYTKAGYSAAATSEDAIRALVKGGYATDTKYLGKLLGIIQSGGMGPVKSDGKGGLTMTFGDTIINGKSKAEIMKNLSLAQAEQTKQVTAMLNKELRN